MSLVFLTVGLFILQSTMQLGLGVVMCIITACTCDPTQFTVAEIGPLNLDNVLQGNYLPYNGRNPTEAFKAQRSVLTNYFRNKGAVAQQIDRI